MKRGETGVCSDCGEEQIIYQAKRGVCRKCYQRSRGRTEGCLDAAITQRVLIGCKMFAERAGMKYT